MPIIGHYFGGLQSIISCFINRKNFGYYSMPPDDFRRNLPRFQEENLAFNNHIIQQVNQLAEQKNCSTAQIALAWVLAQENVIPIPGTTKEANLLSNIAAMSIRLSAEDLQSLNALDQARGHRYTEEAMKMYGLTNE